MLQCCNEVYMKDMAVGIHIGSYRDSWQWGTCENRSTSGEIWKRIVDEGVAFAWDYSSLSLTLGDEMTIAPFLEFRLYFDVFCGDLWCSECLSSFPVLLLLLLLLLRVLSVWMCGHALLSSLSWCDACLGWTWCFSSNRSTSDVTCKWIRRGVYPSCEVTYMSEPAKDPADCDTLDRSW